MSASAAARSDDVKQKLRKVVIGAMTGTVVEWYDFIIYATAATIVFGKVFFPKSDDPLNGVISALLVYAVGFVARPLGGIVFGFLGDRFGRQPMLQWSLLLMGASTFTIGCIPSIDTIGYWAPVLLVICRLMQGFAAGGEWGGAVLIVAENAPDDRRAFWASWPQAALPLGNLAATFVLGVLSFTLHEDAFVAWGWRCAFWVAALIGLVGFYIRKNVEDAPIAKEFVAKAEANKTVAPKLLGRVPPISSRSHRCDGPSIDREHFLSGRDHLRDHVSDFQEECGSQHYPVAHGCRQYLSLCHRSFHWTAC